MKTSDFVGKTIGVSLMALSVTALLLFGIGVFPELLVPGVLFGAASAWLLGRKDTRAALPENLEARLQQLERHVAATQQELSVTQDELRTIIEERDFLRQLRSGSPAPTPTSPEAEVHP